MKKIYILYIFFVVLITSCSITRTERDVYTITLRDTTKLEEQKNAPGARDNGVIYPSSRVFDSQRTITQRDSVVERYYPDFIRLGVFESVGFFFSGESDHALGNGMFGIFPDLNFIRDNYIGDSNAVFKGGLYRFGIYEQRLRWFRDAKDWTYGTSVLEVIAPDARLEKTLASVFPLYIRKRYFLRDEIPYITFTPSFGLGYFPSQYINISGSIDVGSLGGLNLRAYLGLAAGTNMSSSLLIRWSNKKDKESQTSIFPYFGIGISFLDFHNRVVETEIEWKDHEHSSWDIGFVQAALLSTGADSSFLASPGEKSFLSGFLIKFLNADVAIPVLNNGFFAGTSLLNFMVLGKNQWGAGILPVRVGYWHTLIPDELSVEPFLEFNYFPSSFINIGAKLNLRINNTMNTSIHLGYANGTTDLVFDKKTFNDFTIKNEFSRYYLGIGISFIDNIFFPEQLRYFKR